MRIKIKEFNNYIDTLVGYGVNIKHKNEFTRIATFDDIQDAYKFFQLLTKANEVKEETVEIEVEYIYCIDGEYEYKTILRK